MKKNRIWIIIVGLVTILFAVAVTVYGHSDSKSVRKKIAQANKYIDDLQFEEAIALFDEVLTIEPNNAEAEEGEKNAYMTWGETLVENKEYKEAVDRYMTVYERYPDYSAPYDQAVETCIEWMEEEASDGDHSEGVYLVKAINYKIIEDDERFIIALSNMRRKYIEQLIDNGDYEEAFRQFDEWLSGSKDSDKLTFFDGLVDAWIKKLSDEEKYSEAKRKIDELIKYAEDNSELFGSDIGDEIEKLRQTSNEYEDLIRMQEANEISEKNKDALKLFDEDHPEHGKEYVAIVEAIDDNSKLLRNDQNLIEQIDKKSFVLESDKKDGHLEFRCYDYDDKSGIYGTIDYYSVDVKNMTFRRILRDADSGWGEGDIIETDDPEQSYKNKYDSINIEAMYEDIIDKFIYVMSTKYNISVPSDSIRAYVYDNYSDHGSRRGAYLWHLGCLVDGDWYEFKLLYDEEQNELYGNCIESRPLNTEHVLINEGDRIDTFLNEEDEDERERIIPLFYKAIGSNNEIKLKNGYTITLMTNPYYSKKYSDGHTYYIYVDKDNEDLYHFYCGIRAGRFFADCSQSSSRDDLFDIDDSFECSIE